MRARSPSATWWSRRWRSSVSRESGCVPEVARLGELGDRYGLNGHQREQLALILRELAADERAPTAVRDPAVAVDIHLADSLVALELEVWGSASHIADLGAGAGFPGVALAVALAQSEVWLVEAQARKCAFVERLCASAGIALSLIHI